MPVKPIKSVTTTIARAMTVILILSILTTSFALFTLASSLNDAEAVNVSGSLRMQSYRLAYDIENQPHLIPQHLEQFETSLHAPSMRSLEHWSVPDQIFLQYQHIIGFWKTLKPSEGRDSQQLYQARVADFVSEINTFVSRLQHHSERKMWLLSLIGGLGLSLIFIASAFIIRYTRKKIVQPLNQLLTASQQIQDKNFAISLDIDSKNELGALATTFSNMAGELGKLYFDLQQRVNEQTHRLRHANSSLELLYSCSQSLSVTRISSQTFTDVLAHLIETQGITAVKLIIDENDGGSYTITAGEPRGDDWQLTPLRIDDQLLGHLGWQYSLPCPDKHLIENVAQLLARGVYFNRAQKQSEQLLLMEERATIARELHDSLAQSLSYLKIQVTLLKRQLNKEELELAQEVLADIDTGLSSAYTQLRELLSTFRLTIGKANFGEAINEMMKPLDERTDAVIIIDNHLSSLNLQAHEQVHLLQLIREATINAIKHAQADEIIITSEQDDQDIKITIADDGKGFDPDTQKLNHYGLTIMSERASRLQGNITIDSAVGAGCTVTLRFPSTPER